jgi:hypothetical protein
MVFLPKNPLTSTLKADHNPPSPQRRIMIRRKHFVFAGIDFYAGMIPIMHIHSIGAVVAMRGGVRCDALVCAHTPVLRPQHYLGAVWIGGVAPLLRVQLSTSTESMG